MSEIQVPASSTSSSLTRTWSWSRAVIASCCARRARGLRQPRASLGVEPRWLLPNAGPCHRDRTWRLRSPLGRARGRGCGPKISYVLRMFRLPVADELRQHLEIDPPRHGSSILVAVCQEPLTANVLGTGRPRCSARNCARTSAMVGFANRAVPLRAIGSFHHPNCLNVPKVEPPHLAVQPHRHPPGLDLEDGTAPGA